MACECSFSVVKERASCGPVDHRSSENAIEKRTTLPKYIKRFRAFGQRPANRRARLNRKTRTEHDIHSCPLRHISEFLWPLKSSAPSRYLLRLYIRLSVCCRNTTSTYEQDQYEDSHDVRNHREDVRRYSRTHS